MNKERYWPAYDVEACRQLVLSVDDYTITVLAVSSIEVVDQLDMREKLYDDGGSVSVFGVSEFMDVVDEHVRRTILPTGLVYVELSRLDDWTGPRISAVVDLKGVSNR